MKNEMISIEIPMRNALAIEIVKEGRLDEIKAKYHTTNLDCECGCEETCEHILAVRLARSIKEVSAIFNNIGWD